MMADSPTMIGDQKSCGCQQGSHLIAIDLNNSSKCMLLYSGDLKTTRKYLSLTLYIQIKRGKVDEDHSNLF